MRAETHKYSPQDIHVSYGQGLHIIVRTTFCMYLRTEKYKRYEFKTFSSVLWSS